MQPPPRDQTTIPAQDAAAFNISVARRAGAAVVTVSGRLSSAVAEVFQTRLMAELDETPTSLIVDFCDLKFITSAGLRTLILAAKRARGVGHDIHLCGMAESIREVFDVSGLTRVFRIYPSLADGLAALGLGTEQSSA